MDYVYHQNNIDRQGFFIIIGDSLQGSDPIRLLGSVIFLSSDLQMASVAPSDVPSNVALLYAFDCVSSMYTRAHTIHF